jgi:hypothetical protein
VPTTASYSQHRQAPVNYYQKSINNAEYDHANARNYNSADPLAVSS